MKAIFCCIIISSLFLTGFAQSRNCTIAGIIKDSENTTVDMITVLLKKTKDSLLMKSTITDRSGFFEFKNIDSGSYFLSVSRIGFQNYLSRPVEIHRSGMKILVDSIILTRIPNELQEVKIVAQKPFIERKIDKLIVNITATSNFAGQSAFEVLEKSPGISVDENDNIVINGKQGLRVFIDGKISYLTGRDLSAFLRSLPASQLEQLEIMTQPSAKYDAAGNAGILNFITKKNQSNGFNGNLSTSAIFGYHFRQRHSLSLNWRKNQLNFSAIASYANLRIYRDQDIERKFRRNEQSDFGSFFDQSSRIISVQRPLNLRLNTDYFISKKTTLGLNLYKTTFDINVDLSGKTITADSLHVNPAYTSFITKTARPLHNTGVNLNFRHNINPKGREIGADIDYLAYNTGNNQLSKSYTGSDSILLQNNFPVNLKIFSIKSDYVHPLKSGAVIEAGIKLSFVNIDNNATYSGFNKDSNEFIIDKARTNHFIYKERISSIYINFRKQLTKKWAMQAGLRAEQTYTDGNELVTGEQTFRNYFQVFPTAYLSYTPNSSNTFSFSYGRRIGRPEYQLLNPFLAIIDRFNYQDGDPHLLPAFTNNIELSYNYKSFVNVMINYTTTNNLIGPYYRNILDNGNYVSILSPKNVAAKRNLGFAIDFRKSIRKWWNLSMSGSVFNNRFKDRSNSITSVSNLTGFIINVNNQFPLQKGWTLELNGFYRSKNANAFPLFIKSGGQFSLGFIKKILKDQGSFSLNFNDPFLILRSGIISNTQTFQTNSTIISENRYLTATFTYRFGRNTDSQRRRNTVDEQNRVNY